MTIEEILQACRGAFDGDETVLRLSPSNIATDSRQITEGSLFVAIRGEKTDGHKYINDVLSKGAVAVLCEEHFPGQPRIVVEDVIAAMQQIAAENRNNLSIPFVGVTGSVGKTTAKEMIYASLSGKYNAYKTPGSLNGQIGLPVSVIGLDKSFEAAVIEMGISHFGEMTRLTNIVRPDIAVFTNIGDAHLEFLGDRPGVLRAKSEILLGMNPQTPVVCNGDDLLLRNADFAGHRKITFGLGEDCNCCASNVQNPDGVNFSCDVTYGDETFSVFVPAYGTYLVYSVLAAVAVAKELGLTTQEIQAGLAGYQTLAHRSRVVSRPDFTIIDDCYNANPTSTKSAVESMQNLPGRKVCILGDMRELGADSPVLHQEVGEYCLDAGVELILTTGEEAEHIALGARQISYHFETKQDLISSLPRLIQPGDVVLVKASHGARFEEIEEFLEKMQLR